VMRAARPPSRLSAYLRRKASPIWEKIFVHPFVRELYSGTLPLEKFKYYVIQDYNYLVVMMKCLALAASKADFELGRLALELAYEDATIEMRNYEELIKEIGLSMDEVIRAEPSPTAYAYSNFLLTTCSLGTPLDCLVAILPCFWSYLEIGRRNEHLLRSNSNPLYRRWCSAYVSKEYEELVNELIRAVDLQDFTNLRGLEELFITGSRYEYMFWDAAYRMERWPV